MPWSVQPRDNMNIGMKPSCLLLRKMVAAAAGSEAQPVDRKWRGRRQKRRRSLERLCLPTARALPPKVGLRHVPLAAHVNATSAPPAGGRGHADVLVAVHESVHGTELPDPCGLSSGSSRA